MRKAGYLIAAFIAFAVWLFVNAAGHVMVAAELLPFQIFPDSGLGLLATASGALAAVPIIGRLAGRAGAAGYAGLLAVGAAVGSLLVYGSLVGLYVATDETPPQAVKLEGGDSQAFSVHFSADGRTLIGQGKDFLRPVVKLWDARTGELLGAVGLASSGYLPLEDAVFSPDGGTLAVPDSLNKAVTLWDVAAGTSRLGPLALGGPCCVGGIRVVFSPDGKTLAAVSEGPDGNPAVALRDARTGESKRALPGGRAAFSPDGGLLAVWDRAHGMITVWDAQTLESRITLPVERASSATVLAFAPDGQTLVSAAPHPGPDTEPGLGVWDLGTRRFETKLSGRRPTSLAFSPDGRLLALNDGHMVEIYDARSWKRLSRFQPYESNRTVTGSGRRGDPVRSRASNTWPRRLAFSPDSKTLVTACAAGRVRLWDVSAL